MAKLRSFIERAPSYQAPAKIDFLTEQKWNRRLAEFAPNSPDAKSIRSEALGP